MIKFFNFKKTNNFKALEKFLEKRRTGKNVDTSIVTKILNDVKKNKNRAVLKYEKKFSNNKILNPTKAEITKSIKSLISIKKSAYFIENQDTHMQKFH